MNTLDDIRRAGEEYRRKAGGELEKCGTGIGPGGENICPTPGMRIRSGGKGRGLARGLGRGPIGIPFEEKEEE